jgi:hypothetical protein
MHAKRPEGPALSGQRPPLPPRAMSAQVKLASPVYPVYPVRRADRGAAPITRLIHLPHLPSVAGSRSAQLHHIDRSPRQSGFPAWPRVRPSRAPSPGPELVCGAGRHHRAWATERSGSRLGRLPGRAHHAGTIRVSPPLIQSRRSPARYKPVPDARPAIKDSAKRFQARLPD